MFAVTETMGRRPTSYGSSHHWYA